ncbi:OstA-like protein [Pedobacter nototheniae]|uniref:OstA-like protein n=1 Tax=Pedobacter nototheniae TaxID=2488994 RepID=UPI0029319AA6|nr:OstA-like protein [Pedobacter nototheniae]
MQKLFVFLFFLISPVLLFGQQKGSVIKILSYAHIQGNTKTKATYLRNPVFQQDNATLTCDSAIYYSERNYFEAYKNVHINQLTTDIYSDQLEYDGNKKHAHLTGNVKMIDPKSVLTTNILDYDMVSKIGTYTTGGKIVTQDVTLTSKNGYYFNISSDSYFRYNVVVVTPQATIKSDTMRYNLDSKWTYFYGPTNIKGKDDNLYTENGAYNTNTEDAYFGKKNLYTQGTRSLKGDSLYYYGKIGYGKAVKNIVFSDTKDKMKMFGDLGYYYKIDQRTLVTRNAYLGIGTEDSVLVKDKKRPDSLWLGADTLETQMVLQKTIKLIPKISIKADNQVGDDDEDGGAKKDKGEPKVGSSAKDMEEKKTAVDRKEGNKKSKNKSKNDDKIADKVDVLSKKPLDSLKLKTDSIPIILPKIKLDSAKKETILKSKVDSIAKNLPKGKTDSILKTVNKKTITEPVNKLINNIKTVGLKTDTAKFNPADTVQSRIIKAYHGVKIYKSNIQAKTDSLFYTSGDSTLRCFINPIIWSQGSQQIGDTIYVQFKKNKLNNLQAFRNAFLVNTPADSLRFNQIKGRSMTGFFNDGKLKNLYVDGNAESIYYTQDDSTKVYKEMNQTVSSRIKFVFKDNDIEDIIYIKSIEGALNPENTVKKDNVLKGFSWKPTERPKSKKDAIGSSEKMMRKSKAKLPAKKPATTPAATAKPPASVPKINVVKDSVDKAKPISKPLAKPDTTNFGIKPIFPKKDTTKVIQEKELKVQ